MYGSLRQGLKIRVRGRVQGVGFRPYIWRLAQAHAILGSVLNDPEGVLIYACGSDVAAFVKAITADAPALSRIDAVESLPFHFDEMPTSFEITASEGQGAETGVTPDAATCEDCVADIVGTDPRRRGYAFTNCTHCGPRFTILAGLPYDRAQTTMASFDMCAECAAEYADPRDRRFHAQPVACAKCGPQMWFEDLNGTRHDNPIEVAAIRLRQGDVLAVKGLGGFHLCCDATQPQAIATLRARKHRPTKPLALMGTRAHIADYADATQAEWAALETPAAPIVLLNKARALPDGLAADQSRLGWMLPYTPLHHLLLAAVGRPLVMTSGNLSGEPQVIETDEAREKLGHLVDGFVMHNRDIARRLDDSVERHTPHGPMVLRHARGRAPGTLSLPSGFETAPQVTAFGGQMKSAICLLKNGEALLSHHLGDLDDALTWDEFVKAERDYTALFDHAPEVFACDLHPAFRASQYAAVQAEGQALVEVQHHHAHLCAVMAENAWPLHQGRVAGIILDGLGLGTDGTLWGGELLLGDYYGFERVAHLTSAPLVGGDLAQREPWRNGLMRLDQAELSGLADRIFAPMPRDLVRQAATKGINSVQSSSAGRLFDAVAAVMGICPTGQSFEGEAAMALEALATGHIAEPYPFGSDLSPVPLFAALAQDLQCGASLNHMAARFHAGLAEAFAAPARALVHGGQAQAVALSGGCFQNAVLLTEVVNRLGEVPILLHHKTPANDGGLALGQAVIAAARHMGDR